MRVQVRNVSFGKTQETMFTAFAEVSEVVETDGVRSYGQCVFKGTLDDCNEFVETGGHIRTLLVDIMPIERIPIGGSPPKRRRRRSEE